VKPLNVFQYGFSSFLDRRKKLVHGHFGVILVKLREEPGFQVNPGIDGAVGKAPEPIKGYPLKSSNE